MTDKYIIQRDNELARRVPINLTDFFKDRRPTSAAFKTKPDEDGLSVNVLNLSPINETIQDKENFIAAIFTASIPIDAGFECVLDPQPENQAHALIKGNTKTIAKKMSRTCRIEYYVENENLE